jgi:hypothetical protein
LISVAFDLEKVKMALNKRNDVNNIQARHPNKEDLNGIYYLLA